MANRIVNPEEVSVSKALKGMALNFCIGFTLFTLFSCLFGLVFAEQSAKPGIIMCLSIGAAMLIAAALQTVFFTPVLIKRMGYGVRLTLFGLGLYALLAICGLIFNWFPGDNAGAWISFTVSYLVILFLMTALFTAINRRNIKALDEGLERFKAKNGERSERS